MILRLLLLGGILVLGGPPLIAGELRVMSYNIHHGEGTDGKFDLVRIAELIKKEKPDLVALQEIDVKTRRASGVDQAAELSKLTGMHAAFGVFMNYSGGEYGQMVLSRFPIVRKENFKLPDGPEPRAAMMVEVRPNGGRLFFVGLHLFGSRAQRLAQAKALAKRFEKEKATPIILAGDFNSTPDSEPMKFLREKGWVDPTIDSDDKTWPSGVPKVEIDYILHRAAKRLRAKSSKVVDERVASDHRPIVTVLADAGSGKG